MTPTIVLQSDKLAMVVGSPGGPRIITTSLETLLNVFDFGMNVRRAVDAARMHMQWLPDAVLYEAGATDATFSALRAEGYTLRRRDRSAARRQS